MPLLADPHYYCAKFMTVTATKLAQAGMGGPYCLRHSQRTPSFENKIGMHRKWSETCSQMTNLGTTCL